MNRHSMAILCRYREYLLGREQIALQEKMFEEREQQDIHNKLEIRIQEAHAVKAKAGEIAELVRADQGAAYLQSRKVLASRTVELARRNCEEATKKTLQAKCARDQIRLLIERDRLNQAREHEEWERRQLDDLVTARYAAGRSEE